MGELYRAQFENTFRNHPDKEAILEKLINYDNTEDQVNLWFAEAESYNFQALNEAARNDAVDGEGNVTFEVVRSENG